MPRISPTALHANARAGRGFTIVELLIVIVVIGILAAITLVAYNGMQAKTRDNIRSTDAATIVKALEAYKVRHGQYPVATSTSGSGSFETSRETAGSFMEYLKDAGLPAVPTDPINDAAHFYHYYRYQAGYDGCPAGKGPFYVLQIFGYENPSNMPVSDPALVCTSISWRGGSNSLSRHRFENG